MWKTDVPVTPMKDDCRNVQEPNMPFPQIQQKLSILLMVNPQFEENMASSTNKKPKRRKSTSC